MFSHEQSMLLGMLSLQTGQGYLLMNLLSFTVLVAWKLPPALVLNGDFPLAPFSWTMSSSILEAEFYLLIFSY